ncbi:MAG: alpha/beta hydrolase [Pseudomonadota bacterium]
MTNIHRRAFLAYAGALVAAQGLAACAVRSTEPVTHETLDAARFTALRSFVRTPFGDVAHVSHGNGRAVLLLHGFPLNGFQWRGVIEMLSPYARCIAPDFLGMGQSRAAAGLDLGPESQVSMLASLLDSLGIARADFIANDSGGAVAQLFAVRHPERVRSLLLTNGDTEIQSPPAAMRPVIELARQGRFVDEWLVPWYADPERARSDQGIGGLCYADRSHPTNEALRIYFQPLIDSPERKSWLQSYALALGRNALNGVQSTQRESRMPVRIVWGIDDTIFDEANADYLDQSFGNSHGVRRLKNAKLFWPEERRDIVAAQARILWESAPV